jgi:hypothetical protein
VLQTPHDWGEPLTTGENRGFLQSCGNGGGPHDWSANPPRLAGNPSRLERLQEEILEQWKGREFGNAAMDPISEIDDGPNSGESDYKAAAAPTQAASATPRPPGFGPVLGSLFGACDCNPRESNKNDSRGLEPTLRRWL